MSCLCHLQPDTWLEKKIRDVFFKHLKHYKKIAGRSLAHPASWSQPSQSYMNVNFGYFLGTYCILVAN